VFIEAEVQALIHVNPSENDAIIYTDGSVVRHVQRSWAFTAQLSGRTVHEDSGAFHHTTSSRTMEAVTKALSRLETRAFTNASILSDYKHA
jgi:ribonuclease HI